MKEEKDIAPMENNKKMKGIISKLNILGKKYQ